MNSPLSVDIWEASGGSEFVIAENQKDSEVDGVHILARVEGPAFFPDTMSGNKVFYPREAWDAALDDQNLQHKLRSRLLFGTIGHNCELTDDEIRKGLFSHIVTKLWINEDNIGMAEYLVLNTEPGRTLNTLLRAKSRIRVSTRANGTFNSDRSTGSKVVDPRTFKLDRVDFVIEPGYINALPTLVESQNPNYQEEPMDKAIQILESQVNDLKTEKTQHEQSISELRESLNKTSMDNQSMKHKLAAYESLGTPESIQEHINTLQEYERIGSVQDLHEALDAGEEQLTKLADTVEILKDQLAELTNDDDTVVGEDDSTTPANTSNYDDLGSPEEIKDALDQALQVVAELGEYRTLGTPEEIKQCMEVSQSMMDARESEEKSAICARLGVSEDAFDALLNKGFSMEEAEQFLSSVVTPPADASDAAPAVPDEVDPTKANESDADLNKGDDNEEEEEEEEVIGESISSKMLRRLNKHVRIQESKKTPKSSAPANQPLASRLMTTRR